MIHTTNEIRRILESLCHLCTDHNVEKIIMNARKEISEYITQGLPELNDEELSLARDHIIQAIKAYRSRTGCSLSDAKSIIDSARHRS